MPPSSNRVLEPATAVAFSTGHFASRERIDALYAAFGRRMEGTPTVEQGRWSVEVSGLVSARAEFLDFSARGLTLNRGAALCDDGHEHISLGLVVGQRTAVNQNGNELDMQAGSLYVIDFGRPAENMNPDHHQLAIALPRAEVAAALGGRLGELGGLRIDERTGIGAILASHMLAVRQNLSSLDHHGRAGSLEALAALALAALQSGADVLAAPDAADYMLAVARVAIRNHCSDPEFDADRLAGRLNCSRSTLYRLFARHGESISASIWAARLERARVMLGSPELARLPISVVAHRCGFLEPSTFSRQFRQRFGMTPTEARAEGPGR